MVLCHKVTLHLCNVLCCDETGLLPFLNWCRLLCDESVKASWRHPPWEFVLLHLWLWSWGPSHRDLSVSTSDLWWSNDTISPPHPLPSRYGHFLTPSHSGYCIEYNVINIDLLSKTKVWFHCLFHKPGKNYNTQQKCKALKFYSSVWSSKNHRSAIVWKSSTYLPKMSMSFLSYLKTEL